jgi:hypothetical protein
VTVYIFLWSQQGLIPYGQDLIRCTTRYTVWKKVTKRKAEALLCASRLVSLEVNIQRTKYITLSRHQTVGQNHNLLTHNKSFENMEKFKYLGTTVTHQHYIHEEINSRLNSGNARYRSVQSLFSSRPMPKNLKIKICKPQFYLF